MKEHNLAAWNEVSCNPLGRKVRKKSQEIEACNNTAPLLECFTSMLLRDFLKHIRLLNVVIHV